MGEDLFQGFVSTLPVTIGALVSWLIHSRSYKLTQSTNKINLRLKLFDFWQLHQDKEELSGGLDKQLKHLFYLYSSKSVDGRLVWAALRDHPNPEALEQLILAHTEVEVGEEPGSIRHKRPRWKLEGAEVLLFIIYFLVSVSWFLLLGPGLRWIYGDPETLSLLGKIGSTFFVLIFSTLVFIYVMYCFRYVERARAARQLTQTERMNNRQALRLWCLDIWQQVEELTRRLGNLFSF